MTRVKVPVWFLVFCVVALLGSIAFAAVMGSGNRDLRNDVERLQTGIRAARKSQRIISGQLTSAVLDGFRLEKELSESMARLEQSQQYSAELEKQIRDSTNASRDIGESVGRIGEWIRRVEEINQGGEG